MQRIGEILSNLVVPPLTAAIIACVALGVGALIAKFFFDRKRPPFVESFGIGCLAVSLLTLLWGSLGWLGPSSRWSLALPLMLVAAVGWIQARPVSPLNIASFRNRTVLVLMLLLVVGVIFRLVLFPLYPPSGWDDSAFHLPLAKEILKTGRTAYFPEMLYGSIPQNAQMLYVWAIAYSPLPSAHYVHFLAYLFSLLALVRLGRAAFSIKTGWLAALFMGIMGNIQWLSCHAYVDLWVVFYFLATILVGVEAVKEGAPRKALLAGVLLGAAAGVKYTSLVGGLTLAVSLLALAGFRMPGVKRIPFKYVLGAVGLATAVALPWYVRNIVWFHNPFYPFACGLFPPGGGMYGQYGPEGAIDARWMLKQVSITHFYEQGTLWRNLLVQWTMWGVIPAGALFWRSSRFMRVIVSWAVLTLGYFLILAGGVMEDRYYLFLAPMTALTLAHAARFIYTLPPGDERGRFFRVLCWVLLVAFVGLGGVKVNWPFPPLTSQGQERVLSERVASYDLIVAANEVIPEGEVAVGIACDDGRLFADFKLLGGTDVGWANHRLIADSCTSASALARLLRERYDASYLIVNEKRLRDPVRPPLVRVNLPQDDPEFRELFHVVAQTGSGVVYHVRKPEWVAR
jgi:hypothetical protein